MMLLSRIRRHLPFILGIPVVIFNVTCSNKSKAIKAEDAQTVVVTETKMSNESAAAIAKTVAEVYNSRTGIMSETSPAPTPQNEQLPAPAQTPVVEPTADSTKSLNMLQLTEAILARLRSTETKAYVELAEYCQKTDEAQRTKLTGDYSDLDEKTVESILFEINSMCKAITSSLLLDLDLFDPIQAPAVSSHEVGEVLGLEAMGVPAGASISFPAQVTSDLKGNLYYSINFSDSKLERDSQTQKSTERSTVSGTRIKTSSDGGKTWQAISLQNDLTISQQDLATKPMFCVASRKSITGGSGCCDDGGNYVHEWTHNGRYHLISIRKIGGVDTNVTSKTVVVPKAEGDGVYAFVHSVTQISRKLGQCVPGETLMSDEDVEVYLSNPHFLSGTLADYDPRHKKYSDGLDSCILAGFQKVVSAGGNWPYYQSTGKCLQFMPSHYGEEFSVNYNLTRHEILGNQVVSSVVVSTAQHNDNLVSTSPEKIRTYVDILSLVGGAGNNLAFAKTSQIFDRQKIIEYPESVNSNNKVTADALSGPNFSFVKPDGNNWFYKTPPVTLFVPAMTYYTPPKIKSSIELFGKYSNQAYSEGATSNDAGKTLSSEADCGKGLLYSSTLNPKSYTWVNDSSNRLVLIYNGYISRSNQEEGYCEWLSDYGEGLEKNNFETQVFDQTSKEKVTLFPSFQDAVFDPEGNLHIAYWSKPNWDAKVNDPSTLNHEFIPAAQLEAKKVTAPVASTIQLFYSTDCVARCAKVRTWLKEAGATVIENPVISDENLKVILANVTKSLGTSLQFRDGVLVIKKELQSAQVFDFNRGTDMIKIAKLLQIRWKDSVFVQDVAQVSNITPDKSDLSIQLKGDALVITVAQPAETRKYTYMKTRTGGYTKDEWDLEIQTSPTPSVNDASLSFATLPPSDLTRQISAVSVPDSSGSRQLKFTKPGPVHYYECPSILKLQSHFKYLLTPADWEWKSKFLSSMSPKTSEIITAKLKERKSLVQLAERYGAPSKWLDEIDELLCAFKIMTLAIQNNSNNPQWRSGGWSLSASLHEAARFVYLDSSVVQDISFENNSAINSINQYFDPDGKADSYTAFQYTLNNSFKKYTEFKAALENQTGEFVTVSIDGVKYTHERSKALKYLATYKRIYLDYQYVADNKVYGLCKDWAASEVWAVDSLLKLKYHSPQMAQFYPGGFTFVEAGNEHNLGELCSLDCRTCFLYDAWGGVREIWERNEYQSVPHGIRGDMMDINPKNPGFCGSTYMPH